MKKLIFTIFFSSILLSGTVSAQSFSGYKDFRFGMKRNDFIPIVNRICKEDRHNNYKKYYELTKTKDGSIEAHECYEIFGKDRDVFLLIYNDTKELYQIKVGMDEYWHKKPNKFMEQYLRVNKLLRKKYKLEIPITDELYKRLFVFISRTALEDIIQLYYHNLYLISY